MKKKKNLKNEKIMQTPSLSNSSKKESIFQIHINRKIIDDKSKSKTNSDNNSNKKSNIENSYLTPKTKKKKNM